MAKEYVGSGNDDGSIMGRDGGKAGFYGLGTAITKPALTGAVTTAGADASPAFNFAAYKTAAQANHIIELLNLIRARLIALGLMS